MLPAARSNRAARSGVACWLDAALNLNGRLETLVLGNDGALWNALPVDEPPFW
jgi:hypothetical protein